MGSRCPPRTRRRVQFPVNQGTCSRVSRVMASSVRGHPPAIRRLRERLILSKVCRGYRVLTGKPPRAASSPRRRTCRRAIQPSREFPRLNRAVIRRNRGRRRPSRVTRLKRTIRPAPSPESRSASRGSSAQSSLASVRSSPAPVTRVRRHPLIPDKEFPVCPAPTDRPRPFRPAAASARRRPVRLLPYPRERLDRLLGPAEGRTRLYP